MGRCVVLVQDPQLVFPQIQLFLTNSLSHCCQNFQIVSLVYNLTLWNLFGHHDAIDVKKKYSIVLNFNINVLAFFILDDAGVFQRMDCCLVSVSYWNIRVSSSISKQLDFFRKIWNSVAPSTLLFLTIRSSWEVI